jgi:hypothetical protein
MTKKQFENLSPEEVAGLAGKDLAAYNKWLAEKNDKANDEAENDVAPTTQKEAADKFFEQNPDYHLDSVLVAEDLTVFHGDIKGENTATNYCGKKFKQFKK